MPSSGQVVAGNAWTLLGEWGAGSGPRAYVVSNLSTSANPVEVLAPGLPGHPTGVPTTDEGITLEPGQSITLSSGLGVSQVWARSLGATISHGASAGL